NPDEVARNGGAAAYLVGNFTLADSLLQISQGINPLAPTAAEIAMTKLRLNQFSEAVKWIGDAIKIDPDGVYRAIGLHADVPFVSIFALAHLNLGNLDVAFDAADAALRVSPVDPSALEVKGKVLLLRGNANDAKRVLEQAKANAPLGAQSSIQES